MTAGDLRRSSPAPGVLQLDLARPDVHNAITLGLQRELDAALAEAADDPDVRVVLLTGEGTAAFSAGYDLKELRAMTADASALSLLERDELLWRYFTFPKPIVAAVQGMAYGAGTLLAVCSDLRVGGPGTRITVTAAKYGGANLTWVLDHLIGAGLARDLLMTSREVTGEEAHRMGLVSRYAADGDVLGAALEAAGEIAAQPPESMREIKTLLLDGPGRDLRSRYDRENVVSRTTLRPRPVEEMFGSYFGRRAR